MEQSGREKSNLMTVLCFLVVNYLSTKILYPIKVRPEGIVIYHEEPPKMLEDCRCYRTCCLLLVTAVPSPSAATSKVVVNVW